VEVSNAAADFTEEQATIGKYKFDILALKRKIDHALHDIGARVLEISRTTPSDPLRDREVRDLLDLISDLELQIERKRRDINAVTEQFRRKREARERSGIEYYSEPAAPRNPTEEPTVTPKKRGRKPGTKNRLADAIKETVVEAPKKRGRKPAAKSRAVEPATEVETVTPEKPKRKPRQKDNTTGVSGQKRGRPSKPPEEKPAEEPDEV